MQPSILALLLSAALLPSALPAQKPPTPAPAPTPTPPPPAPSATSEIKLTNRSAFAPDGGKRSPFLPVGWTKKVEQRVEAVSEVRPEMFKISAILLGNPPLAIINGKDRGVGDRVPAPGAPAEVVTVKRIEDGQVILLNRGKEILVPSGRR